MAFFPVDDQAAFHPKFIAAGNTAVGVWTRAGSWCKAHTTGGKIPTEVAHSIGPKNLCMRLVAVGLWELVDGGYLFHDWTHVATNDTAEVERARRELSRDANRERQRRYRDRHTTTGNGVTNGEDNPPVTDPPSPSPSPLTSNEISIRPVPERESYPQDGPDESIESICARQAEAQGVDFGKVKTAIGRNCGRFPDPTMVMRIIATVLERAKPPIKSPTGVVLTAIANDWAEWQKFLDEEIAS